jgi:hypothetical protein
MAVKQFLATAEIDIEEESITWMTGFKRYSATFADFAAANSLNYGIILAGLDLYTEDKFEDLVQFYEPARLGTATIVVHLRRRSNPVVRIGSFDNTNGRCVSRPLVRS